MLAKWHLRLRFGGEEMDAANEKTIDYEELL
jgi:hypothetical protein